MDYRGETAVSFDGHGTYSFDDWAIAQSFMKEQMALGLLYETRRQSA